MFSNNNKTLPPKNTQSINTNTNTNINANNKSNTNITTDGDNPLKPHGIKNNIFLLNQNNNQTLSKPVNLISGNEGENHTVKESNNISQINKACGLINKFNAPKTDTNCQIPNGIGFSSTSYSKKK